MEAEQRERLVRILQQMEAILRARNPVDTVGMVDLHIAAKSALTLLGEKSTGEVIGCPHGALGKCTDCCFEAELRADGLFNELAIANACLSDIFHGIVGPDAMPALDGKVDWRIAKDKVLDAHQYMLKGAKKPNAAE